MSVSDEQEHLNLCCPECGGDPCVLKHRPAGWSSRSRQIPLIIWAVFMLITIVVVTPWGQAYLGVPWAVYQSGISSSQELQTSSALPALTAQQILDDPIASARLIDDAYRDIGTRYGNWWEAQQARFVFVEPTGMIYDQQTRGLGGTWLEIHANTMADDLSLIPSAVEGFNYPLEALRRDQYATRFPSESTWSLSIRETRLQGAQSYSRQISVISMLGCVIVLQLIIRGINTLLKKMSCRHMRRKRTRLVTELLGVVLLLLIGFQFEDTYRMVTHTNQAIPTSGPTPDVAGDWITGEQLDKLFTVGHPGAAVVEQVKALASMSQSDLVLGYQVQRDFEVEFDQYIAGLFGYLTLGSISKQRFFIVDENEESHEIARPSEYFGGLKIDIKPTSDYLSLSWGSKQALTGIMLKWTHIVVIVACLWSFLMISLRIGRRFAYRTQRRRVKRDQCIFCGYPLSPDACKARDAH